MNKRVASHKLFRLAREEWGAALVEFAMSAMVLMSLTVGVIALALAMYTYHFLSSAAQQGMRFAIVRGYTWSKYEATNCSTSSTNFKMVYDCTASATDIQNYVQSLATGGINPANVTINTTSSYLWPAKTPDGVACSQNNAQGCLVKVTVSYTFHYFPFERLHTIAMSSTSEGVILQ